MPPTADAAKTFNNQLRATAEALGGLGTDHRYGFVCQCGCGETARLTLAQYDECGGAWLEGHQPA
jgi:hypothetical protein